jgi:hypothetical protein
METRIFERFDGSLVRTDVPRRSNVNEPSATEAPPDEEAYGADTPTGDEELGALRHEKRWRYARCIHPLPESFLDVLGDGTLLVCGDGFRGASVGAAPGAPGENGDSVPFSGADEAFTSGTAAAARVLSVWLDRRALPSPDGVR